MLCITINTVATGKRIKELRKEHNLKVREIMEALGLESEQAIYKWQRGDSVPTIENLVALSMLFDCTMDDIVVASHGRDEEGESPLLPINGMFFLFSDTSDNAIPCVR